MIKLLFVCDKNKTCKNSKFCGTACHFTSDPNNAKNKDSVRIAEEFLKNFESPDAFRDIGFIEKDS